MSNRPRNVFLRSLDEASFQALESHFVSVDLAVGQQIHRAGDKLDWVYFPETCLVSMVSTTASGETVETSMVGLEGAAGLIEACGSGRAGLQAFIQVDGRALRAPAFVVRDLAIRSEAFSAKLWALIEYQLYDSRRSGLCNALHTVEQRLARWLLECAERCGGRASLPLTQEVLGYMLGVQRTTVSTLAGQLQRRGLISQTRGQVVIADPPGLENHACECRGVVRAERDRLGLSIDPGELRLISSNEI